MLIYTRHIDHLFLQYHSVDTNGYGRRGMQSPQCHLE